MTTKNTTATKTADAPKSDNLTAQPVAALLKVNQTLTNFETVKAELSDKHTFVANMIKSVNLTKEQIELLRKQQGIGETLEKDLEARKVDAAQEVVNTELRDNADVDSWRENVTELDQAAKLIEQVNLLRVALGQHPFFIAYTGTTTKTRVKRGDNGSTETNTSRAMYMRPGDVMLNLSSHDIRVHADLDQIVISSEGHKKEYKQGAQGIASLVRNFLRDDLGHAGTNLSYPAVLAQHGYAKDDVYMLTKPDASTPAIKQPVKEPAK